MLACSHANMLTSMAAHSLTDGPHISNLSSRSAVSTPSSLLGPLGPLGLGEVRLEPRAVHRARNPDAHNEECEPLVSERGVRAARQHGEDRADLAKE